MAYPGLGSFPPISTGSNLTQNQVAVLDGNTTDSVAGIDINSFVEGLQSGLAFANAIYDTGNLILDATKMRLTNNSGKPFSFKINVSGVILSDSSISSAVLAVRLNSSGGVGAGTLRRYPAGLTTGLATIDLGFSTNGVFTIANGESVWLECAKNVLGTLIISNCLVLIEPIW